MLNSARDGAMAGKRNRAAPREKAAAQSRMYHRNAILKLGKPPKGKYTAIPNDSIRDSSLDEAAFRVFALLLSHDCGWETSASAITEQLGWGKNRNRAGNALRALVKDRRLVIRDCVKASGGRVNQQYILYADGRRFTDAQHEIHSRRIVVDEPEACTKTVQGWSP